MFSSMKFSTFEISSSCFNLIISSLFRFFSSISFSFFFGVSFSFLPALFNLFLCLQPTMNGSQEDSVEVEEAALAELERELEQRWGESWQIALLCIFYLSLNEVSL